MMTRFVLEPVRAVRLSTACAVLLAVGVAVLPGCGGGGGSSSPTTPSTPAPTRSLLGQGNFTLASTAEANDVELPFDSYRLEMSLSAAGTVEIQADWTFASNDIDIELSRPPCAFAEFYADSCSKVAEAVSATQKPERLTAANVAAGTYVVYIYGVDITNESGNYQIYVTR